MFQGNFFQNIGSIILFSVFGTAISAFIVGGGIYFLGRVSLTALKHLSLSGLLFQSPFFKSRQIEWKWIPGSQSAVLCSHKGSVVQALPWLLLGRLWSLFPWKYSKAPWTQFLERFPRALWSRKGGVGDLRGAQVPTWATVTLWHSMFCGKSN